MFDQVGLSRIRCPAGVAEWSEREVMLYALAIGMGSDPMDADQLLFVYEKHLRVVPTFATVAAWSCNPPLSETGVDMARVVHAGQEIDVHRAIPVSARVTATGGFVAAVDKGDRGALIFAETVLRDAASGDPYVTLRQAYLARVDGNFGAVPSVADNPHAVPERVPDLTVDYPTRPDQALLYRLLGDRNPLHADPEAARSAGFDRPILHGLCTFGVTCRAILESCASSDPARIRNHAARFSAPVYPGETISVDVWRDGPIVSFEARVAARGVRVVRHGRSVLMPESAGSRTDS